jgi:hypothetical protein
VVVLVSEASRSRSNTTTTVRKDFAQVVEPLERATRRRLGNPQRQVCLDAFAAFPDGVIEVARTSLQDARSNPLGLFFWRIQNGWHELEPVRMSCDSTLIPDGPVDGGSSHHDVRAAIARSLGATGIPPEAT